MRLDRALVELGLARSRSHAAQLVRDGRVRLDDRPLTRPAHELPAGVVPEVDDAGWVSRAAYKLLGALSDTGVAVPPRVLDAGSSTGGFTQVLLERGADTVYAVDVGTDQLVDRLRHDPRVRVHEQTNLRDLTLAHVDDQPVALAVADVSFISLRLLLGPITSVLTEDGTALLMVKPQFEVGRELLGRGGVVRDERLRRQAVTAVIEDAAALGWRHRRTVVSRLPGPAGNVEYFVHLSGQQIC